MKSPIGAGWPIGCRRRVERRPEARRAVPRRPKPLLPSAARPGVTATLPQIRHVASPSALRDHRPMKDGFGSRVGNQLKYRPITTAAERKISPKIVM